MAKKEKGKRESYRISNTQRRGQTVYAVTGKPVAFNAQGIAEVEDVEDFQQLLKVPGYREADFEEPVEDENLSIEASVDQSEEPENKADSIERDAGEELPNETETDLPDNGEETPESEASQEEAK